MGRRVTFLYDATGNRTGKRDPRGIVITYVYDPANRLTAERYSTGKRHTFAYEATSNRTLAADPTGRYTSAYDAKNRPSVSRSKF